MKRFSITLIALSFLALASCKEEKETPKVIYEDTPKTQSKPVVTDSAQIEIADLPIQMDGTKMLIHPIADLNIGRNSKGKPESSSVDNAGFRVSNYDQYEITGFLRNLKFQEIGSDSLKVLTEKPVLIQTATFLKSVSDKTKKQVLVYTLADMDTNKDGKVNASDIKTLYLSEINGNNFTKLSADFQELIDWNLIESSNKLYFRTIEDTNKNGAFDENDVLHYSFVDLAGKDWKVQNYKPI
jgi:hypothetical protein